MQWFPLQTTQIEYELTPGNRFTTNGGQLHLEGQTWGLGGPGLFFPP